MSEQAFLDTLLAPHPALAAAPSHWLKARRARALERASALAVPTVRDEEWRFTDLSPLYRSRLQPAAGGQVEADRLALFEVPEAGHRLVFVDGRFGYELSTTLEQHGAFVGPLAQALKLHADALETALGKIAQAESDLFTAVNTAYLQDAAVVYVAANQAIERPIHVLHVAGARETAAHPRVLVIAERGASCTVIEDFVALGGIGYLTNAVAEISIARDAEVRYVKLQREADTAFHLATTAVRMERNARFRNWSVSFGGRISRHSLNVYQAGEAIDCEIDGLALIGGRQLADTHSAIEHAFPHGRSRQLHKTIASGAARTVFNGKILVRQAAQQTDSAQQSRNLLLSPRAQVDAKPQLEIFADDVKCAHGATVGQLDADEMFYLKSRGLSESTARNLLTYAFAADVVERIPVPSLVRGVGRMILDQIQEKQ
jgi:Fe-S cluster assembly protein SufD